MAKKQLFKKIIVSCSVLAVLLSWCNSLFQWQLLGISASALMAITIFMSSVLLWLFVAIDWPSLLTILGIGLIPELSFTQATQLSFGNPTFVFLLLTFIVTYALNQTPFLKRVTNFLLTRQMAQKSAFHFIVYFLMAVLLLSSFLSPTVTFMFLFPLYEELVYQFHWKKGDKAASYLLIAMFTTIAIGTAMTPINHVFAITALSIYQNVSHVTISTIQYMTMAVPIGLLLFSIVLITLKKRISVQAKQIQLTALDNLPAIDRREKWIVSVFLMMIGLWLLPEMLQMKQVGLVLPPLLATIILASFSIANKPLVDLSKAFSQGIHWPSMLLVSATLALGSVISNPKIGVIPLIQNGLGISLSQMSPIAVIIIFIVWAGVQTNFTSNLVTVSLVTTVLMTLDIPIIHQGVLSCLIGFMSSVAIMSAPAMPYVAISVGSGWTNTTDCLKYGGLLLLCTIFVAIAIGYPLGILAIAR